MQSKYTNLQHRNDYEPGYIYLMEAEGYHGIIPGCYLRRCKIGLSRNPQLRLENFHSNQPPCNIRILKTIYVEDMAEVETHLHNQFRKYQVKNLAKSREWFDLNPVQMARVNWAFAKLDTHVFTFDELPIRVIILCLLGLIGVGAIAGHRFTKISPQIQPQIQSK